MDGENKMNCALCKYRAQVLGFEAEVGLAQESHHHHVEGIGTDGEKHDHPHANGHGDHGHNGHVTTTLMGTTTMGTTMITIMITGTAMVPVSTAIITRPIRMPTHRHGPGKRNPDNLE